jgi:hypothetical protein
LGGGDRSDTFELEEVERGHMEVVSYWKGKGRGEARERAEKSAEGDIVWMRVGDRELG